MFDAHAETVTAVEKCCHRVDAVEEAVVSVELMYQPRPLSSVSSTDSDDSLVSSVSLCLVVTEISEGLVSEVSPSRGAESLRDPGRCAVSSAQ